MGDIWPIPNVEAGAGVTFDRLLDVSIIIAVPGQPQTTQLRYTGVAPEKVGDLIVTFGEGLKNDWKRKP